MTERIGVVGAGTMGSGIALLFAGHGHVVEITDRSSSLARRSVERLHERVELAIDAGLHPPEAMSWVQRITVGVDLETVAAGAEVVIEAVSEDLGVKEDVLGRISAAAGEAVLVASNTSSLPIDRLAASVHHPERFLGMHFFNPPELVPGVEVITHPDVNDAVVARAMDLLRGVGKQPARVASSPGFLANRLQFALFVEAARCVDEGLATPEDIDTVVRSTFGFRLPAYGPFAVADMAGLDVYGHILGILEEGLGERFALPAALRRLLDDGRFGLKSHGGFHDYQPEEVEQAVVERDRNYQQLLKAVAVLPAD